MAKKADFCPMHCPNWILWIFALLGLWFTLSAFGMPIFGGFWSWIVLLSGICSWVCASDKAHRKTNCPFAGLPVWFGVVFTIIGAWFVLGDTGILPTYGINLLYISLLIIILGIIGYKR